MALVVGVGLVASAALPSFAVGADDEEGVSRASAVEQLLGARSSAPSATERGIANGVDPSDVGVLAKDLGTVNARALSNDPDYWMFDSEYDSPYDSLAYPELGISGMAVAKSAPDTLMTVALASPGVDSTVSRDGALYSFLDTNNDGRTDYATVTPAQSMYQGSLYSSPVYRFVGDSLVGTGVSATWLMTSSGWSASFPWRSLGISAVSFSMGLEDADGYTDWSPDAWSTYAQLAGVVGVVQRTGQTVAGSVTSKTKAKKGKRVSLPRTTNAGNRINWTSKSKKLCRTAGSTLKLTGRKGKCRIVASAQQDATHYSMRRAYKIRVK